MSIVCWFCQRKDLQLMLNGYGGAQGWDRKTGYHSSEKLKGLNLDSCVQKA